MIKLSIATPWDEFLTGLVQLTIDQYILYPEYRDLPVEFAREILGVTWTDEIQVIARALLKHKKIVVPAGHAVGKTHGVAGIALWWLSTRETKVVTTAPTWRQVKDLIWRELRSQHRKSDKPLPGNPNQTEWNLNEDIWFATGISTNDPTRFQGYHAEELLIIIDEACGIESFIWEAIEDGLAVGDKNKILAIGNPTDPTARFARAVRSADWKTFSLSCLDHPNIKEGKSVIKGAVSVGWVEDRIERWCIPYEDIVEEEQPADVFEYKGQQYIPNDMFRVRVLGEFPIEGGNQIFPLSYIWKAFNREPKDPEGSTHMGLDIARFGDDTSVLITGRSNGVVLKVDPWQGHRTTESAGRVKYWVAEFQPVMTIAVDGIGYGAGTVDILAEGNYPVLDVNVAESPWDKLKYTNLRDELYFELAEQFKKGKMDLTRVKGFEEVITEELATMTFKYTPKGQRKVQSKEEIKKAIGRSPDFADALMLFNAHCEADFLRGEVVPKGTTWDDYDV